VDVAGERVGGEDPGAGAVGELEGRDVVRRLIGGRSSRGGRGGGCSRRLSSPLGGRGGLLLRGLLLAGLRHHGYGRVRGSGCLGRRRSGGEG
jgi:hypothetical protein